MKVFDIGLLTTFFLSLFCMENGVSTVEDIDIELASSEKIQNLVELGNTLFAAEFHSRGRGSCKYICTYIYIYYIYIVVLLHVHACSCSLSYFMQRVSKF